MLEWLTFFFGVASIKSESANDDLRKNKKLELLKQFYKNGRPIYHISDHQKPNLFETLNHLTILSLTRNDFSLIAKTLTLLKVLNLSLLSLRQEISLVA